MGEEEWWRARRGAGRRGERSSAFGSVAANTPENPASNQKIVTTAALLRHFDASFRFKTELCGARTGDSVPVLVLRGSGDPSLSSEDLRALAKTLAQSGIKRVGELLLDQSFFDAHYVPPAFEQQPQEWAAFRAPVSAVSLDRNVTTLNVAPTELGQPAKVWFDPEGFVDVTGEVHTQKLERAQNVKLTLRESGHAAGSARGRRHSAEQRRVSLVAPRRRSEPARGLRLPRRARSRGHSRDRQDRGRRRKRAQRACRARV